MATHAKTREGETVRMEDIVEVGTRVSWGAILAGAVMALAVGFIMSLLGGAIGLSFVADADTETLGYGAAIWAIATTILALFVGGYITSQCVVGETKTESVVHGIIMWGVVLAMLLYLTATGIGSGFSSMLQVANVGANASENVSQETMNSMARSMGFTQEDIDRARQNAQAVANDPEARREAHDTATQATWWTFAGTIVSMAAAIVGAIIGAGPTFRLLPLHVTHRHFEGQATAS